MHVSAHHPTLPSFPTRRSSDLEYARSHREQLVLKPNRGYGGTGVVLGLATEASEWEGLLQQAASTAGDPEQAWVLRSEEHTSELQSPDQLVCRLLLEKKKQLTH